MKVKRILLITIWFIGFVGLSGSAESSSANSFTRQGVFGQQNNEPNADCLMCHANPNLTGKFANGESISLFVDNTIYAASVHGPSGLECIACHTSINDYPHHDEQAVSCRACHIGLEGTMRGNYVALEVQLPFASKREMTITINESCRSCHEEEFDMTGDSAHVKAQLSGNQDAPLCVDCHGSHDTSPPDEPRAKISHTCARCHLAVYSTYRSSVHGQALEAESNPDVPTCVNCHGVHNVRGPRDPAFHNDSIIICGECHADEPLMEKYDISTNVFETYLDDFHGRSVDLSRSQNGSAASNKAVCFDCHGIHNIRKPEDPHSSVYPENLQSTCQQCHADATISFPSAWLSHYLPTWENTPVLYMVNITYPALISLTLGGFIGYIALDIRKRWSDKRQFTRQALLAEEEVEEYDFN